MIKCKQICGAAWVLEHLFLFNELLHASRCVCCVFFLSGRMVCCIINVLVLSSQQGDGADRSPSRTNTCQQIKKEALSGRSVQCVGWCRAWGEPRGHSGQNRKLTSVSQSCSPRLPSQGSANVSDADTVILQSVRYSWIPQLLQNDIRRGREGRRRSFQIKTSRRGRTVITFTTDSQAPQRMHPEELGDTYEMNCCNILCRSLCWDLRMCWMIN